MTLFQTFVDASEAESARWFIQNATHVDKCAAFCVGERKLGKIGTRAECTRWIAEQAARKGFEAMLVSADHHHNERVASFLRTLAAEPETTSGEAENDHGA